VTPQEKFCPKLFSDALLQEQTVIHDGFQKISRLCNFWFVIYEIRARGDKHITASKESILLAIKFRIVGKLRFLSHAETVRIFQRACIRAGIGIRYSQGYNPRPKLSLPLPRSVGIESDDDLLCVQAFRPIDSQSETSEFLFDSEQFKARLSSQLPEGCELLTVSVSDAKTSFQPRLATYVLAVRREYFDDELKVRIKRLLGSESLTLERRREPGSPEFKNVDVRGFLKSVQIIVNQGCIVVECKISPAGSIRVEEILKLLELDTERLAAPVRRTKVQWEEA